MLASELEQAECAERVQALFEAEVDECFQGVRRNLDANFVYVETVERDHVLDDPRVTRLLKRLKLERLPHGRVQLKGGASADHRPSVLLGLERVRPKRKAP